MVSRVEIVFSNNEAITAALCKLDPHIIAFAPYYDSTNQSKVDSTQTQSLVENHIKRTNIENPRVKKVVRVNINATPEELKKFLNLGSEGFLIDVKTLQRKNENELLHFFQLIFSLRDHKEKEQG